MCSSDHDLYDCGGLSRARQLFSTSRCPRSLHLIEREIERGGAADRAD